MKPLYIAVDFDGTCVKHAFPKIGDDIGAVPVLKKLVNAGHKIILYTMRSHNDNGTEHDHSSLKGDNDTLQDAIDWFKENDIPLYGVNDNPSQHRWTGSAKIYANIYIDDAALGIPLLKDNQGNIYVDWIKVESMLKLMNVV